MKVLILTAEGFEDSELLVPMYRFLEEGAAVDIASFTHGAVSGKRGYTVEAGLTFEEVIPSEYGLLCVPGGKAPGMVRCNDAALDTVRHFFAAGKPACAICHGPLLFISAGVMSGRTATCYPGVAPEMRASGARYEDAEVVVDGNLVTSRIPRDLPAFMRETMKLFRAASRQDRG